MKKCPNCASENADDAAKCGSCGRPLSDVSVQARTKNCLSCGAAADDDAAVCAQCGHPFASRPHAGADSRPVDRFQPSTPASEMLAWGWCLLLLGIAMAIGSLFLSTSVDVDRPLTLSSLGVTIPSGQTDSVYNLGKLQLQQLLFDAGCAFFVLGGVLIAAASAARTVIAALRPEPATAPPVAKEDIDVSRIKPFV